MTKLKPGIGVLLLGIAIAATACAGPGSKKPSAAPAAATLDAGADAPEFGYDAYNELLGEYVDDRGSVNYRGLHANRAALDGFVRSMGRIAPEVYEAWSRDEKMALWINAYNALTLQYILDNYPIKKGGIVSGALYPANSIRQIDGVWDELTSPVAGREWTLEDIEHKMLRKEFGDARIHVAIVCASGGCPPLRNEAFMAETLDAQLEDQSRKFVSHPDKFRVDRARGTVYLSPILNWFGKDFIAQYGAGQRFTDQNAKMRAVLGFVSRHVSDADRAYLESGDYRIKFSDYDWSLNGK